MSDRQIKMKIYLDSLDSYYSISNEPKEKHFNKIRFHHLFRIELARSPQYIKNETLDSSTFY